MTLTFSLEQALSSVLGILNTKRTTHQHRSQETQEVSESMVSSTEPCGSWGNSTTFGNMNVQN